MINEVLTKKNINFGEVQEDFLTYLDVEKGSSKTYKCGIVNFLNYLNENNIKNPTRNDLRAFREELKISKSINTINNYLTATRLFFKYLEANHLYEDITKGIKSLKCSSIPKSEVLSEQQCKKIYNSLTDLREKCIFSLAITTGLRANEIANAKIENLKFYNNELVLFVKCKKRDDESEYVKVSNLVLNDIKNYIGERTSGYIFISTSNNNNGGGVSNKTIRLIVKNIFKRFGIEKDWVSCHTLRRTMATISYNSGANIVDIQQVLHQKSIATTRRYINNVTRNNNKLEYKVSDLILGGN